MKRAVSWLGTLLVIVVLMVALVPGGQISSATSDNITPVYGLNFGPYTQLDANGTPIPEYTPISEERIRELMGIIAPYTQWIRTYSARDGLEVSGRVAHELGLKIAAQAWIDSNLDNNEQEIANLIAMGQAGEADLLIVGSEVLLRNNLSESQLIQYINRVKQAVPGIPVTTADGYSQLLDHHSVMNACDVVFFDYYPYWMGIGINSAISRLQQVYQQVVAAANGKPVVLAETGWPSGGNSVGSAVASPSNASLYFSNVISWARSQGVLCFYFEAFDEPWKAMYEGPQGAHWGVWDKDGNLKPGMRSVFNVSNTAPVATGDSYGAVRNTALTVPAPGVLGNDHDAEGNSLTATPVNPPAHGTLALNANGSFTYTPATGYTGTDSFTYKANDGSTDSNTATVTITISGSVATSFGFNGGDNTLNQVANELIGTRVLNSAADGTVTKLEMLFDDSTPSGSVRLGIYADSAGVPGARLLDAGAVAVANGWVQISGLSLSVTKGSYYWLVFQLQRQNGVRRQSGGPANSGCWKTGARYGSLPSSFGGASGYENQQYVMRATIASSGNSGPVAVNDTYSVDGDIALGVDAPGVLGNDSDAGNNTLMAILVSPPSHGTLTLNADGSFIYTPDCQLQRHRLIHLQGQRGRGRIQCGYGNDHGYSTSGHPDHACPGDISGTT